MVTLKSKRNRIFPPDDTVHFPELKDGAFMDDVAFEIDGIMAQQAVLDTVDGVVGKDADFESKHPRGLPGNAGEFAPVGGSKRAFEKAAGHWHSKILDLFPGTPGNPDPRTQTEEWQNVYYAHPAAHQIGSFNRKVEAFVAKFPETGEMVRQWAKEVNNLAAQVIAEKVAPKPPTKREVAATERKEKVKALAGLTAMVGEAMAPSRDQFKTAIKAKLTDDLSKLESDLKAADWDFRKARPFPATNIGREAYIRMEEARRDALRWVDFANPSGSMKGPQPCTLQGTPSEREARLESKSNQLADESYQAFTFKLADKIAEAAGGKEVKSVTHVSGGDVWGWSTLRAGLADGSEIRLETKQIINVSCLGKLFNQWPTRVAKSEDIAKYNPDQPRVPAGSAQGGEFTAAEVGGFGPSVSIKTSFNGKTEVSIGGTEFQGPRIEPFPLPSHIPELPKDKTIWLGEGSFHESHVIDTEAFRVYTFKTDPKTGELKYEYSADLTKPNPAKQLGPDAVGSAAWAQKMKMCYGQGSAFDTDIAEFHKWVNAPGADDKFDEVIDRRVNGHTPPTVGNAIGRMGQLEAIALKEPVGKLDRDFIIKDVAAANLMDEKGDRVDNVRRKVDAVLRSIDGMSRLEAIQYLNKDAHRLALERDRQFNKTNAAYDAMTHEERGGDKGTALWKAHSDNHAVIDRQNTSEYIRRAIVADMVQRLIPKSENDHSLNPDIRYSAGMDEAFKAPREQQIKQGMDWLNEHLSPSAYQMMSHVKPDIEVRPARDEHDRAYYTSQTISLRPDNNASVVVHEYGHHLGAMVGAEEYSKEFIRARALPDAMPLNRLTGRSGVYKPEETAFPDRFIDAYVGKKYDASVSEVVSMGIQKMSEDPVAFYRLDREHFFWTLYLMWGGLAIRRNIKGEALN